MCGLAYRSPGLLRVGIATYDRVNDAGKIAAQAVVESSGETHAVLLTPSNNGKQGKAGGCL